MPFKPKTFVVMLVTCTAIAGAAAWVTGLNFWILDGITIVAVLVNGVIASIEDNVASPKGDDEPPT
jgi:hypothetical protein